MDEDDEVKKLEAELEQRKSKNARKDKISELKKKIGDEKIKSRLGGFGKFLSSVGKGLGKGLLATGKATGTYMTKLAEQQERERKAEKKK